MIKIHLNITTNWSTDRNLMNSINNKTVIEEIHGSYYFDYDLNSKITFANRQSQVEYQSYHKSKL